MNGNTIIRNDKNYVGYIGGANLKKAFTLAEVLISLVVIGVIAAITLQVLYAGSNKKALEAGFKKNYSVIAQISRKAASEFNDCDNDIAEEVKEYLNKQLITMKNEESRNVSVYEDYTYKTFSGKEIDSRMHNDCLIGNTNFSAWGTIYRTILNDGTYMGICSHLGVGISSKSSRDGVFISIDTNGAKGPNKMGYDVFHFHLDGYNCSAEPAAGTYRNYKEDEEGYSTDDANAQFVGYCSKESTSDVNGFSCAQYALSNKCPSNSSKTYWECI